MQIVYNSPLDSKGRPNPTIPRFNFEGQEYFDQNDTKILLKPGEFSPFPDAVAEDMVKRWEFLEIISAEKAKELQTMIKCERCEVTFKPEAKSALEAHVQLKHVQAEKKVEEEISGIPVKYATEEATPNRTLSERREPALAAGPDFYGPGLTTEPKGVKPRNVYS